MTLAASSLSQEDFSEKSPHDPRVAENWISVQIDKNGQ